LDNQVKEPNNQINQYPKKSLISFLEFDVTSVLPVQEGASPPQKWRRVLVTNGQV
jgi:hypothetical protein